MGFTQQLPVPSVPMLSLDTFAITPGVNANLGPFFVFPWPSTLITIQGGTGNVPGANSAFALDLFFFPAATFIGTDFPDMTFTGMQTDRYSVIVPNFLPWMMIQLRAAGASAPSPSLCFIQAQPLARPSGIRMISGLTLFGANGPTGALFSDIETVSASNSSVVRRIPPYYGKASFHLETTAVAYKVTMRALDENLNTATWRTWTNETHGPIIDDQIWIPGCVTDIQFTNNDRATRTFTCMLTTNKNEGFET